MVGKAGAYWFVDAVDGGTLTRLNFRIETVMANSRSAEGVAYRPSGHRFARR